MATEEEVFKYILQVENEEKVRTAAAAAALAEQKFKAMFESLGAGHARTMAAASALVDLKQELKSLESAAAVSGQKLLQFGRTVDDLQYVGQQGIQPILNNIMEISPAIGLALVAGNALYKNWDQISGLFGMGATKTEAERMEELGKKTATTAEEAAKLLKYEQMRKDLEAQRGPTAEKSEHDRKTNEAIRDAPEADVRRAVDAIHGTAIGNAIPVEIEERLSRAKAEADKAQAQLDAMGGKESPFGETLANARRRVQSKKDELGAAQGARDTAYNENRDKVQAALLDPRAMERFLKEALEKGLLSKGQVEKLRASQKTPDEIEAEKSEEYYRKQDQEHASKKAAWDESGRLSEEEEEKKAQEAFDAREREHKAKQLAAEAEAAAREKAKSDKLKEQRATTGTGLNERGEQAMMRSMLAGGSRDAVTKRVADAMAKEFESQGIGKDRAREMAGERAEGLYGKLGDEAMSRQPHQEELKNSMRIGAGDFAASVEGSGMKKMETLTEQVKDQLALVVQNTRNIRTMAP